jgi:hypothetical protein
MKFLYMGKFYSSCRADERLLDLELCQDEI